MLLFILFFSMLIGLAVFHIYSKLIGFAGSIILLVLGYATYNDKEYFHRLSHSGHHAFELLCVIISMFLLGHWFSKTGIKEKLEEVIPDNKYAPAILLTALFFLSMAMDNIAVAIIGSEMASIFPKVHPGFLTAIVGACNAGGSPTFTGDTTTYMIATKGHTTMSALLPALITLVGLCYFASKQQNSLGLKQKKYAEKPINWLYVGGIIIFLVGAITTMLVFKQPLYGITFGVVINLFIHGKDLKAIHEAKSGLMAALFLGSIIIAASMLDLSILPVASPMTAFLAGILSMFLDNIPVTEICLNQGGYPSWGMLAYSVGYAGSLNWWASSAGVALAEKNSELQNTALWVKSSWYQWLIFPTAYWISHVIYSFF